MPLSRPMSSITWVSYCIEVASPDVLRSVTEWLAFELPLTLQPGQFHYGALRRCSQSFPVHVQQPRNSRL